MLRSQGVSASLLTFYGVAWADLPLARSRENIAIWRRNNGAYLRLFPVR